MRASLAFVVLVLACALFAQESVYVCPMDPDVRSSQPGRCRRCGMKLETGIPDPVEYLMDLGITPRAPRPRETVQLEFIVRDPWNDRPVTSFQPVHEKLFHLFVVDQGLEFFVHDHPALGPGGKFRFPLAFPHPGLYRVLGDFYPDGGMPQLIAKSLIIPGAAGPPIVLARDYSTKQAANLQVELRTDPPEPIAGIKTMMFFRVTPAEQLEKYLGAWGHMLAASEDLIDMIHSHPFLADGGPGIQFNLIFPRARTYRIWVQFQRNGVVNTARFDVPVHALQ